MGCEQEKAQADKEAALAARITELGRQLKDLRQFLEDERVRRHN